MNNPYYAAGLLSALFFWVWPAFLYKNLDAHASTVLAFSALLFVGAGRVVSEIDARFIARRHPPQWRVPIMVAECLAIVAFGWLTRIAHDAYVRP